MINILSVDFDWIMEPSINVYNNLVSRDTPIDAVLKSNPGITIKGDMNKYQTLCTILGNIVRQIKQKERVLVCTNHEDIISCIENDWGLNSVKYNIYNVDHHHDCGYDVENMDDIHNQGLTCGNWVHYCKQLGNYTWINNQNSNVNIPMDIFEKIPNYKQSYDINLIGYVKFDYVFVCLSPEWIPSEYFPLYDTLNFSLGNLFEKERLVLEEHKIIDLNETIKEKEKEKEKNKEKKNE